MKKKIMVVDDDLDILLTVKNVFEHEGYEVATVESGKKCYEMLEKNEIPDIILLDIMMPKMSGWEVNKELRKHPELRRVPVIMVTAVDRLDEQLKSLGEKNIKDYITKPFNFSELVNTVKRVLGQQIKNNSESSFSLGKNKQGELNE